MKVYFRTDSSDVLASGHLERCLTLADYLKNEQEHECIFICREHTGNIDRKVTQHNHQLIELPAPPSIPPDKLTPLERYLGLKTSKDIGQTGSHLNNITDKDWIITDHYGIDAVWEHDIHSRNGNPFIMAIDDKADRHHYCDILLDHNCNEDKERYDVHLKKGGCAKLLGPEYAILRQEFYDARDNLRKRDGELERIFVFYGGVDIDNATLKTLKAIHLSNLKDLRIDVLIGAENPHKMAIEEYAGHMHACHIHQSVREISSFMTKADIAFGGGGVTALERAFLGLPTFVIILADNQRPGTECLANAGAVWNLGDNDDLDIETIKLAIDFQVTNDALREMSAAAFRVFGKSKKRGVEKIYNAMKGKMNHG
ncbi:MAG: UDP-2,4-diacetamido-2,4,6-trideoxy-beta-L-altropyranose hydrolase [Candidatus Zixiibacteriota bacterium]